MFVGISIGINSLRNSTALPFSPSTLFALSEPGVWFDPSDLTTLFTDTAGTTPVTTPGQTVGLMLDKSKGLALGTELVVNGTFATNTSGWTLAAGGLATVSGGVVTLTNVASRARLSQFVTTVSGRSYRLTVSGVNLGNSPASSARVQLGASQFALTAGTNSLIYVATGTSTEVVLLENETTAGLFFSIDDISVKELAGNHATQATAASRPTYQVEYNGTGPLGSELVTNGTFDTNTTGWSAGSGAILAVVSQQLVVTNPAGGTNRRAFQAITCTIGSTYLVQGTVISNGRIGIGTSTVATETFQVTGSAFRAFTATATTMYIGLAVSTSVAADTATFDNISVKELPAESWRGYLSFDGVDDGMVTGTITPGVDKAQVFAGVRKLLDPANMTVAELGVLVTSTNGSLAVITSANNGGSRDTYTFSTRGTATVSPVTNGYAAPITNVVTGLGDISGDTATLRVNGAQVAQLTTDQGTGNYLAYPLYVGRRAGTTLPFNGQIYSLLVRFGANLSAGQITDTETWVNGKTGAY